MSVINIGDDGCPEPSHEVSSNGTIQWQKSYPNQVKLSGWTTTNWPFKEDFVQEIIVNGPRSATYNVKGHTISRTYNYTSDQCSPEPNPVIVVNPGK